MSMEIQYDIHTLKNVTGEGGERKNEVLRRLKPLTEEEIAACILDCCPLTKDNVKAEQAELRYLAVEQLLRV